MLSRVFNTQDTQTNIELLGSKMKEYSAHRYTSGELVDVCCNTDMSMLCRTDKDNSLKELNINKFEDEITSIKNDYVNIIKKKEMTLD